MNFIHFHLWVRIIGTSPIPYYALFQTTQSGIQLECDTFVPTVLMSDSVSILLIIFVDTLIVFCQAPSSD
jgi:hypothetical protein